MDRKVSRIAIWTVSKKSLSARRAWIEIKYLVSTVLGLFKSLSARRAWIEIAGLWCVLGDKATVALRKESVDRNNLLPAVILQIPHVALRKESVDRNHL